MPSFPPTVDFKHKVTWTVKGFGLFSPTIVRSPTFDFRCLDVTTWSFDLHPNWFTGVRNVKFAVRLHYPRSRDASEFHIMSVKYVIYLVDQSGSRRFETEGFFSPTLEEPVSSPIDFISQYEFEDKKLLTEELALVMGCELTTKVNQVEFMASVYDDEMVSLSGRLSEMLGHPTHADMIAYSKDTVPFDVHTSIMKTRCPILFSESPDQIRLTAVGRVWSSSISTRVLRALLFYLYGRTTIEVENCNKAELLSLAILYRLSDLEKKLTEYPDALALTTDKQEKMLDDFPLVNFNWVDDMNRSFQRNYRGKNSILMTRNLVLSYKVMEASDGAEAYVKIAYLFSEIEPGVQILLTCTLFFVDMDQDIVYSKVHSHNFTYDEEWTTPPFLTTTSLQQYRPVFLFCETQLTMGSKECLDSSNVHRVEPGRCVIFNNFLLVADDLLKMYINRQNCDLKIKVQEFEFLGHRSFLVKRSPKIRKKLEELESEEEEEEGSDMAEIRLNFIDGDICPMVMLYMYSGRIDLKNSEMAKRCGTAASYFHLPFLVDKCFFFKSG